MVSAAEEPCVGVNCVADWQVDEPAAAAPVSGSSQGLPTSFQLADLVPAACEAPLTSGQSPPA